jgi:hypothetical protein
LIEVRIPMPAGASLAEAVEGARMFGGVLSVRRRMPASALPMVIELPIRFGLAGKITAPEAEARLVDDEAPKAFAPAQALSVD